MERKWFIYTLSDPRSGAVRYVGWTYNLKERLDDHIRDAHRVRTHKANWIKSLLRVNLKPKISQVEEGYSDWAEAERRWIAHYRSLGCKLTNATDGGEGVPGLVFSQESRRKMSAAKVGRRVSPTHRENLAAANARRRGQVRPVEVGAKISAAKLGHEVSKETREKISASLVGRKHSAETKAKMSQTRTGMAKPVEGREKYGAGKRGVPLSLEHRRKLSEAKRRLHKEKVNSHD